MSNYSGDFGENTSILEYPAWLLTQLRLLLFGILQIVWNFILFLWSWRGLVLIFILFWSAAYLVNSKGGLILSQIEHYNRCTVWPKWVKFFKPLIDAITRIYDSAICWINMMGQINRLLNTQLFIKIYENCDNGFDLMHWLESIANIVVLLIQNVFRWAFLEDAFEVTISVYEPANILLMELIPETALGITCLCKDMSLPTTMLSRVLQSDHLVCAAQQAINVIVEYYQVWVNFYFDLLALMRTIFLAGGTTSDVEEILKGQISGDSVVIALTAATMLERINSISIYLAKFTNNLFTRVYCTITAELDAMGDHSLTEGLYQTCISLPQNNPELFITLSGLVAIGTRVLRLLTLLLWHFPQLCVESYEQPPGPRWMINTWYYKDWAIVFDTIRVRPFRYRYNTSLNNPVLINTPGTIPLTTIVWPNTYLYGPAQKPDCTFLNVSHTIVPCQQCPMVAEAPFTVYLSMTAKSLDDITRPIINMTLWEPVLHDLIGGVLTVIADISDFAVGFVVHLFNWDRMGIFLADQNHYDIVFNSLMGPPMVMGGVLNSINTIAIGIDPRLDAVSGLFTTAVKSAGEALRLTVIGIVRLINTVVGTSEPGFDEYVCITDNVNCILLDRSLMWIRRPRMNELIWDTTYGYVHVEPFSPKAFVDWLCYWVDYQVLTFFTSHPASELPDICCFFNYLIRAVIEYLKASATLLITDYQTFKIFIDPSTTFESIFIKWVACTDLATCNNMAAFLSDLEDLLNCPCLLIFEIEALGFPAAESFNCICDTLGPAVKTLANLARSASTFLSVAARVIYCAEKDFPEPDCSDTLAIQMDGAFNRLYDALQALAETGGGLGCIMGMPWVLFKVDCLGIVYTWPLSYPPCNTSHNGIGNNVPCAMPDRLQMLSYHGAKVITTILIFIIGRVQSVLDTGLKVLLPGHQPLESGRQSSCMVIQNFLMDASEALFGISDVLVATSLNLTSTSNDIPPEFNSTSTLDSILRATNQNATEFYLKNPNATLDPSYYIQQYINYTPPPSTTVYASNIDFVNLTNVNRTVGFIQALALTINCIIGPPIPSCLGSPIFEATPKAGGELSDMCFGTLLGVGGYDFADFFPLAVVVVNDLCNMLSSLLSGDGGGFMDSLLSLVLDTFNFLGAFLGSTSGIIAGVGALIQVMSGYIYGEVIQILFDFGQTVIAAMWAKYKFSTVWESWIAYFGYKRDYGGELEREFVESLTEGTWCRNATEILINYDKLYLANELIWYGCFYAASAPLMIKKLTDGKLVLPMDFFYNKDTFIPVMENLLNLLAAYFKHRTTFSLDAFITQIIEVPQGILSYAEAQLALQELNAGITPDQLKAYSIILNVPNLTSTQLLQIALDELSKTNMKKRTHVFDESWEDDGWIFKTLYPQFQHPYNYTSPFRNSRVSFGKSIADYLNPSSLGLGKSYEFGGAPPEGGTSAFNLGADLQDYSWATFLISHLEHKEYISDQHGTEAGAEAGGDPFCELSNDGQGCSVDLYKLYPGLTLRLHEDETEPILVAKDKKRGFIDAAFGTALADNIAYDANRDPNSPKFNPFYQTNINLLTSLQGGLVLNISGIDRLLPVINGKIAMSYENVTFLEYMELRGWNNSINSYFISYYEDFEMTYMQDNMLKADAHMSHFVKILETATKLNENIDSPGLTPLNESGVIDRNHNPAVASDVLEFGSSKRTIMSREILNTWEKSKRLIKEKLTSIKTPLPKGSIESLFTQQFKQEKTLYFRLNAWVSVDLQQKLASTFAMSTIRGSIINDAKERASGSKKAPDLVERFWSGLGTIRDAYYKIYSSYDKAMDHDYLHVLSYQGWKKNGRGRRLGPGGDDDDDNVKQFDDYNPRYGKYRGIKKRIGANSLWVGHTWERYRRGLMAHHESEVYRPDHLSPGEKWHYFKRYFLQTVPQTLAHLVRSVGSYYAYHVDPLEGEISSKSVSSLKYSKRAIVEPKFVLRYDALTTGSIEFTGDSIDMGETTVLDEWGIPYTQKDEVYVIHGPSGNYATYKWLKAWPIRIYNNPVGRVDVGIKPSVLSLHYAHPDDAVDHHYEVEPPKRGSKEEIQRWLESLNSRSLLFNMELNYYEKTYLTIETRKKCVNNWLWNEHHLYDLSKPGTPSTIISDRELEEWQSMQRNHSRSMEFTPKEIVLTLHKCYRQKSTLPIHPHQEKYGDILKGESIYYHRWTLAKNMLSDIWNTARDKLSLPNIRRKFKEVYVTPLLDKYARYVEKTGRRPAISTPLVAYENIRKTLLGENSKKYAIPDVIWVELGHPITFYRPDGLPMDATTHEIMKKEWLEQSWQEFYRSGSGTQDFTHFGPSSDSRYSKKRSAFPPLINMCLPTNAPEQTCLKCEECINQDAITDERCYDCDYCQGCLENPNDTSAGAICNSCGACSVSDSPHCTGTCTGCTNCTFGDTVCLDCLLGQILLSGIIENVNFCYRWKILNDTSVIRVPPPNTSLIEIVYLEGYEDGNGVVQTNGTSFPNFSDYGFSGLPMYLGDLFIYLMGVLFQGIDLIGTFAKFATNLNEDPANPPVGLLFWLRNLPIPYIGRCRRDVNLMCTYGMGLVPALKFTAILGAVLAVLVFLQFSFPAAILITLLFGIPTYFKFVAWFAWLWNPSCGDPPTLGLFSLLGIPWLVWPQYPVCAMEEIRELLNSLITQYTSYIPPEFYVTASGTLPSNCAEFIVPPNCTAYGFTGSATTVGYLGQKYFSPTLQYWLVDYLNTTCLVRGQCTSIFGLQMPILLVILVAMGLCWVLGGGVVLGLSIALIVGYSLSGVCEGILSPFFTVDFRDSILNNPSLMERCFETQISGIFLLGLYLFIFLAIIILVILMLKPICIFIGRILTAPPFSWITPKYWILRKRI